MARETDEERRERERVDRVFEHLRTRPFVASIDEGEDVAERDDGDMVEADITFLGRRGKDED